MGVGLGSTYTWDGRSWHGFYPFIPVVDIANQPSLAVALKRSPTEFSKGVLLINQTSLMR